jgi:hypothetical protein
MPAVTTNSVGATPASSPQTGGNLRDAPTPSGEHHSKVDGSHESRKRDTAGITAHKRRAAMVYEVKEPRSSMPLKEQLWMTFESPSFSPVAFWYAQFSLVIITVSTLTFCLETELNCKDFSLAEHTFVTHENCAAWEEAWTVAEYVAVIVFSVELILRFLSTPSKWLFIHNMMNWVDLIAVLPFYLERIVGASGVDSGSELASGEAASGEDNGAFGAFSVFRVVRLVRPSSPCLAAQHVPLFSSTTAPLTPCLVHSVSCRSHCLSSWLTPRSNSTRLRPHLVRVRFSCRCASSACSRWARAPRV